MNGRIGKSRTAKLALAGMLLSLGFILPFFTAHGLGVPGTVLLPMHFPVFLGGLIGGPLMGLLLGLCLPLLSGALTGMPALYPMVPIMTAELAAYGAVSGLLYHKTALGKWRLGIYPCILLAMICGRAFYGAMFYILLLFNSGMKALSVWGALAAGVPGITVQLLLLPLAVKAAERYFGAEKSSAVHSAVNLIREDRVACLVIRNGVIEHSEVGNGIAPILRLYDANLLKDTFVVDKIVGKAAAMIMTEGGVRGCHATVISRGALEWFSACGIRVEYDSCTDYIVNRKGDGICPMEETVREIDEGAAGVAALREKLRALQAASG